MPSPLSLAWLATLLGLLSGALPAAAQPSWEALPASPFHSYRFEDAAFLSPERGWIVDGSGETYETTNAGATWTLRSDIVGYLRSSAFVRPDLGWIGVLYGPEALLETRDGGATMTNVTGRISPALPPSAGICGLFALSETDVWGVGQWNGPGYTIHTIDGGATWARRDLSALAGSLIDVHFHDALRGVAVGGTAGIDSGSRAVVLGTTDGGLTWSRRFVSSGAGTVAEWAWKVSFPTPDVGYVSVEYTGDTQDGKVLKTTDGGLTWTELRVPGGGSMQGVGFLTPDIGWTSGRGRAMRTLDGGATWAPTTEIDGSVNRFEFFGDTLGFAMGRRVFRLVGATTDTSGPPPATPLRLTASPNPARGDVVLTYTSPDAPARVMVTDALGRRVAVLDGPAGVDRQLTWRAAGLAPGIYAVRLAAGGDHLTRRLVLLR